MSSGSLIVLAAGGTGGHLFPASVVAEELARRGHEVMIVTDARGIRFARIFGNREVKVISSGRVTESGLRTKLEATLALGKGLFEARNTLRERKPAAVVGFGGYATMPVLLAATSLGIPTCVHEQNAVLGRVNRWLSPMVDAIALSYAKTKFMTPGREEKAQVTGNPVRAEVAALAEKPYPTLGKDGIVRILVVGGSLGATVLSDIVPVAVTALPPAVRSRLQITQQCRAEDLERTREQYRQAGVAAEVAEFLEDMPERLSWTHLVIARAGASTLAEVAAAGRPAILVPLPIATDDHQTANARSFEETGAGWLVPQPQFTAADVAKRMQKLINKPETLAQAAAAARQLGKPEATRLLTDLIEGMARAGGHSRDKEDMQEKTDNSSNTTLKRAAMGLLARSKAPLPRWEGLGAGITPTSILPHQGGGGIFDGPSAFSIVIRRLDRRIQYWTRRLNRRVTKSEQMCESRSPRWEGPGEGITPTSILPHQGGGGGLKWSAA